MRGGQDATSVVVRVLPLCGPVPPGRRQSPPDPQANSRSERQADLDRTRGVGTLLFRPPRSVPETSGASLLAEQEKTFRERWVGLRRAETLVRSVAGRWK